VSPRKNDARAAGRGRSSGRGQPADREPRDIEKAFGFQRAESARDGDWIVRSVAGASTAKTYRCPGCDQEIRPGMPHLVAWPADSDQAAWHGGGGLDDRRHWHTPCWNARLRRR
jgi:hypothetical protein